MKNKIILIFLVMLFSGTYSCKKDLLKEQAFDFITPESFYKTEADATAGVNAIYNPLVNGWNLYGRNLWMMAEYPSEASDANGSGDAFRKSFDTFSWDASGAGLEACWTGLYQGIFRANSFLAQVDSIKQINAGTKIRLKAEAKFMRAYYYFTLMRFWDHVPYVDEKSYKTDMYPTNVGTDDKVWGLILSDLQFAQLNLPVAYDSKNIGRATRGAAKGILAKVYLTLAGFPWNKTENWALAAAKAKEIIDSTSTYHYALESDFSRLFALDNEHGSEYMFSAEFASGMNLGGNIPAMIGIRNGNQTKLLGGFSSWVSTKQFFNTYDPTDKRLPKTFVLAYTDTKGQKWAYPTSPDPATVKVISLTSWNKYIDPNEKAAFIDNPGDFAINMYILRYADLLLVHSEAENETNGPSALAVSGINQVRARAGLAPIDYTAVTQVQLRAIIVNERAWELAAEAQVYFDYKRQHVLQSRLALIGMDGAVKPKHYSFPIPQQEVDISKGALVQEDVWK
jgi:starch-binding outer membrane protein, SusD/RagB family